MAFQSKLHSPDPPRRVSAQELAQQLHRPVEEIMAAAHTIGEFVESPRKRTLESPTVNQIRAELDEPQMPAPIKPIPQWERRGTAPTRNTRGTSQAVLGSRFHGEPVLRRRDRFEPFRTESAHDGGLRETTDDVAMAWASASWSFFGFAGVEKDAWIAAGVQTTQAKKASLFREAGLLPSDLGKTLHGWSVIRRLNADESPRDIRQMLDREARKAA